MRKRRKILNPPFTCSSFLRMGWRLSRRISVCRICLPVDVENNSPEVRVPMKSLSIAARDAHRSTSRSPFCVFNVRLDFAALCLLSNVESVAIFADMVWRFSKGGHGLPHGFDSWRRTTSESPWPRKTARLFPSGDKLNDQICSDLKFVIGCPAEPSSGCTHTLSTPFSRLA